MASKHVRAGTGLSTDSDARNAGIEAAKTALARLNGEPPALLIVFTTPKYELRKLLAGIRSVTGACPLVGATGAGEIVEGRYLEPGGGVVLLALTAGPYRFGIASGQHIRGKLDEAGQSLAAASRKAAGESPHAAMIVFANALIGDLQQLVQGIYRVTGPKVPMVGAGAIDDLKFAESFVFHNDTVVEEGAVIVWIASEQPLHVTTKHGWQPLGIPLLVTRAAGTEIVELGGRAAAEAYEEQLGLAPGALTPDKFWNTSIAHPFGLLQPDGSAVIRVASARTPAGTLMMHGCVPPTGSAVQVMESATETLLAVADESVQDALKHRPDAGVVLVFDCAARAMIFGGRVAEEATRMQSIAGPVPTFGFYCCPEFARTSGVLGTHNATLTAIAL